MKIINIKVSCGVPEAAELIGFIFQTKENYILNLSNMQGVKKTPACLKKKGKTKW